MDLSVSGGSIGGSRSNIHDYDLNPTNSKNNKTKCNDIKQDIRYKFQLKKHIAYKVCL